MSSTYTYRPPLGFDIRVKPPKETREPSHRVCDWPECENKGLHRAPKKDNLSANQWFCLEHVREFNRAWNFFQGMSDGDIKQYVEDSITGHRPTWSMGSNSKSNAGATRGGKGGFAQKGPYRPRYHHLDDMGDPYNLFSAAGRNGARSRRSAPSLTRGQVQALETLDLDETATKTEIKAKYKKLVKKYHPDANGGDTGTVERLRSVIRAYHVLKTANLVPDS